MKPEIKKNELSGRELIICMFLGILAIILISLFIKRQIIRFTLKNRRGPHYPIGANASKFLKKEIERRLLLTKEIKTEPLLINGENQFNEFQSKDEVPTEHFYRMKAIDELKKLEELIVNVGGEDVKRKPNHDLKDYLISLTKGNQVLNKCDLKLLNQFVDMYSHARHQPDPVFNEKSYNDYMATLQKIQKFIGKKYSIQTNVQKDYTKNYNRKQFNQTQFLSTGKTVLGNLDESSKETCV